MIFEAKLHGAKFSTEPQLTIPEESKGIDPSTPIFKDPDAYKHMTDEEKEAETKRMIRFLKGMVHNPKDKLKAPRKYFSGMRM